MKKLFSTIGIILTLVLSLNSAQLALASATDTDFGPMYYLEDGETVDYEKSACEIGLQVFIAEKGADYHEFMSKHMSNPDIPDNLLDPAMEKYEAYKKMLKDEYFKYKAKTGRFIATQLEQLEKCFAIVDNEIKEREIHLDQSFTAGAFDRATLRYTDRLGVINTRLEELHFQFAQFLGRMKSFSDGLPCYSNKCAK
ncbi:hypothetical protein HOG48_04120 [Candidatus Peregrinibacteria bacterium]|jgi:hypothetical protein|nr:hypothetical protein [Candidatus Peregrinibacteria bacterium]